MTKISNQYSLTNILTADLANSRIGINNASPSYSLDVTGTIRLTSTLTTNIASGLLKSVSNVLTQAVANTDYQSPITLTTTGTSGAATFSANTLNIPQYQAVLTNPVTGTGTTSYIPKFTGGSALGNSSIYDDGTNIGIGTTTPNKVGVTRGLTINAAAAGQCVFEQCVADSSVNYYQAFDGTNINLINQATGFMRFGTSGTERMRITSGGNVGVNTSTNYDFGNAGNRGITLNGNTGAVGYVHLSSNNTSYAFWYAYSAESFLTTYTSIPLLFGTNGTEKMRISANGSIGAGGSLTNIYNASDVRLKKNISTTTYGLNTILALNPVKFNWVDGFETKENGKNMLGFIAQEVQEVIPEAIESFGENSIIIGDKVIDNPLRVNEKFIIPLLVKAIQELKVEIETLKQK